MKINPIQAFNLIGKIKKMKQDRFEKELKNAWLSYQDMWDRYFRLLRRLAADDNIQAVREDYASHIRYALEDWSTPSERFETGGFDDTDLGL